MKKINKENLLFQAKRLDNIVELLEEDLENESLRRLKVVLEDISNEIKVNIENGK